MKNTLKRFLSGVAVFGFLQLSHGLNIIPTFDSSITGATNAVDITNAIIFCIQTLQSNLTDNSTVKILFKSDPTVSLGQSLTWGGPYSYSGYLTALKSRASTINDTNALSKIPNSPNDPLVGTNQIYLNLPLARLMGLDSGYGSDGYDSTISFNMTQMSVTRPPPTNEYDFIGTVEHEMNEVLGWTSDLQSGYPLGPIGPADLFRYTTNLVRTWTTNGDNAYFSVDGTNLLARFNQDTNGDYHDWWSANALWAPPGQTPHVQVQDAFGTTGNTQDEGPNELAALDVIGYTPANIGQPTSPTLTIFQSGANQFTISWPNGYSGFVLQESTNLASGSWTASATGSSNPAVIASTNVRKFYRLYQTTILTSVTPEIATSQFSANSALRLVTRNYEPRKP